MSENPIEITRLDLPELAPFTSLTEAQLRSGHDSPHALFIAESPKVIEACLDAGCLPVAMLCERRHIAGDAARIIARCPGMKVYTGPRALLASLTGYTLTRGVLCAMRRPDTPTPADVCRNARRIAVADGVVEATNIGAMFRSAAALGIDGLLLTPQSCDPLNRRALRVSMGTVMKLPWAWLHEPVHSLSTLGFKTVAMALTPDAISIADPLLTRQPRLAIVLGTEGDGLAPTVIAATDFVARIPMSHGVDSLNVAAAAAVAFWQLRATDPDTQP